MRGAAGLAILVAVVLALAGCTPNLPTPTPSPAQVVGTWRHGGDILQLDANGTFAVSGMPTGVVNQSPVATGAEPAGPNVSITGTWSIGAGGTDVGGNPGIQLDFVSPKKVGYNYGLTLVVAGSDPLKLYVTLGRPDSDVRYSFTRQ